MFSRPIDPGRQSHCPLFIHVCANKCAELVLCTYLVVKINYPGYYYRKQGRNILRWLSTYRTHLKVIINSLGKTPLILRIVLNGMLLAFQTSFRNRKFLNHFNLCNIYRLCTTFDTFQSIQHH